MRVKRGEGGCECELRERVGVESEVPNASARSTSEDLIHAQLSRCSSVRRGSDSQSGFESEREEDFYSGGSGPPFIQARGQPAASTS